MPYYYGYRYYFDWTWILILIGMVICLIAQARVKGSFSKYSRVMSRTGMTGAEAARRLLDSQGIYGVQIQRVALLGGHRTKQDDGGGGMEHG